MNDVARELSDLLHRERRAALEADVAELEAIQEEKRALFDRASASDVQGPAFQRLAEVARANLALIRQLVALHRALAGVDAVGGYGADGAHASVPVRHARGAL